MAARLHPIRRVLVGVVGLGCRMDVKGDSTEAPDRRLFAPRPAAPTSLGLPLSETKPRHLGDWPQSRPQTRQPLPRAGSFASERVPCHTRPNRNVLASAYFVQR